MNSPQPNDREGAAKSSAYSAPALEKAIDILELLASDPSGLTISEIAQKLGRSISEIFRIMIVMERRGWLRKEVASDRYRVTYRVLDMAMHATPAQELTQAAAPIMQDLAARTNQSCHLVVRGEGRGLVVQRQENMGPFGFGIRLGASIDLATSCSGHILLAFLARQRREAVLSSLLLPPSLSRAQLAERLDLVRAQGHELQPSARTAGVTDVSYPVFGIDGHIAAALTIPFMVMIDCSQATNLDETRLLLQAAAQRISGELGWFSEGTGSAS